MDDTLHFSPAEVDVKAGETIEFILQGTFPNKVTYCNKGDHLELTAGINGFGDLHQRIRMELIPGTSHFLPMERPDLVRAALLEAAT